jgi:16S rRNA (cytosine1402-N4)-methyltransferase
MRADALTPSLRSCVARSTHSVFTSCPRVAPDGQYSPLSARSHRARAAGGQLVSTEFSHTPVMLAEVLELFDAVPSGLVLDATLGGAGHASALLERREDLRLLGIDRDPAALEAAGERLARFGERATLREARFDALGTLVDQIDAPLAGALFDLGVSSHQLDVAERGFSFRLGGPLDMRMGPDATTTAAEIVNSAPEEELAAMFHANGEERLARRIAHAIVAARPIERTDELAAVVEAAVPPAMRRRGHPARRVFQALRVAVNAELEVLAPALTSVIDRLVAGGRVVVLSYHSGEDRLVKSVLAKEATGGCTCPPRLPCVCGAVPRVQLLNRGARLVSEAERGANPRAEPVRLRAAQRLATPSGEHAEAGSGN